MKVLQKELSPRGNLTGHCRFVQHCENTQVLSEAITEDDDRGNSGSKYCERNYLIQRNDEFSERNFSNVLIIYNNIMEVARGPGPYL